MKDRIVTLSDQGFHQLNQMVRPIVRQNYKCKLHKSPARAVLKPLTVVHQACVMEISRQPLNLDTRSREELLLSFKNMGLCACRSIIKPKLKCAIRQDASCRGQVVLGSWPYSNVWGARTADHQLEL